jgi:hypothetical protein
MRQLGLEFVDVGRRFGHAHAPFRLSHAAIARRNARVGQRPAAARI